MGASLSNWRDNPVYVGGCANSAQDVREMWKTKSADGGGGGEFAEGTSGLEVVAWLEHRSACVVLTGRMGPMGRMGLCGAGLLCAIHLKVYCPRLAN